MSNIDPVRYVAFAPEHTGELNKMWRASFEKSVAITDPHPLEEQRDYLLGQLVPNYQIRVALDGEIIVGFVAASDTSVAQLYVRIGYQRRGIGSRMLDWAKGQSGGSLVLYTFKRNQGAQLFYESQGFEIVKRGFDNMWKLESVHYRWTREEAL